MSFREIILKEKKASFQSGISFFWKLGVFLDSGTWGNVLY